MIFFFNFEALLCLLDFGAVLLWCQDCCMSLTLTVWFKTCFVQYFPQYWWPLPGFLLTEQIPQYISAFSAGGKMIKRQERCTAFIFVVQATTLIKRKNSDFETLSGNRKCYFSWVLSVYFTSFTPFFLGVNVRLATCPGVYPAFA